MGIDLYWLPLGAGGHFVRRNGRVFEALAALIERRQRYDLYHSALEVRVGHEMFVIEMTPVRDRHGSKHGGVAEGAVGSHWLGQWRLFRYEIRRWRGGGNPRRVRGGGKTPPPCQTKKAGGGGRHPVSGGPPGPLGAGPTATRGP